MDSWNNQFAVNLTKIISRKMPHRVTKKLFKFRQNQNNKLRAGSLN